MSDKENETEQTVTNSKNQVSVLKQLTGNLPPAPNIVPRITGDSEIKDLGAQLIAALTDLTVNLEAKTRITASSRSTYTKSLVLALRYGPVDNIGLPLSNNVLWNYAIQDLKLAVSEKGQRSKDVVDIAKSIAKIDADMKAAQAKEIKV